MSGMELPETSLDAPKNHAPQITVSQQNSHINWPTCTDRGCGVAPVMPLSPRVFSRPKWPNFPRCDSLFKNRGTAPQNVSSVCRKFVHKRPLWHRPRTDHFTSDAESPACRLVCKVVKFSPPRISPKTSPAHPSECPKFAQKWRQTHQPHLSHYTNDASEFPWRVAYNVQKFNPLINLKNLKGESLYAMNL